MHCAICGHDNPPGTVNCVKCGTALSAVSTGGVVTPASGPSSAVPPPAPGTPTRAVAPQTLAKGVRLQGGNYAVGDVLGQGGFGITYKGGDITLRRYVALKEFFPPGCVRHESTIQPSGTLSPADYAGVKAKFVEEARMLARFSDPGIVRVYGVFEENNTAYMVMEYLEGQTLAQRLTTATTLEPAEVINIGEKVGTALAVVHQAGLIHRDLKPENICLTKDGRIVLIDFGTARAFASGKTVHQTTLLTPGYAPLEQYGNEARFGAYTDIYALAATLYQCLTGQVPPQATDRAIGVELKAPHLINARVPEALSKAVVWALQIKAADRPQSFQEFLPALKGGAAQAAPATGTVLLPDNAWSTPAAPAAPTNYPTAAPSWSGGASQPAYPGAAPAIPLAQPASMQLLSDEIILTNADPVETLQAVYRAFVVSGVTNATIDSYAYRISGSTGADMRSWGQKVTGQISADARGTMITLTIAPSMGVTDWGRGKEDTRRIMGEVQNAVRALTAPLHMPAVPQMPAAPIPYPGPQQAYPAYPDNSTHYPQVRVMPDKKGNQVFVLGLIGVFCCGFCAPVAWVLGNNAMQEYGGLDPGDRTLVISGRILGIVGTIMLIFWTLVAIGGHK